MNVYITLWIIACLSAFPVQTSDQQPRTGTNASLWFLFFAVLVIIVGLRYDVGTDYSNYRIFFDRIADGGTANFEPAFLWLNHLARLMGTGLWFVMITAALITNAFTFANIVQKSENQLLSFVILFGIGYIAGQTNQVRQYIAVGMVFFSYRFIVQQNLARFVLLVTGASLFHWSAAAFLPFYWLSKIHLKLSVFLLLWISVLLPFIFVQQSINLAGIILMIAPENYRDLAITTLSAPSRIGSGSRIWLEQVAALALYIKFSGKRNSRETQILANLVLFGILIQTATAPLHGVKRLVPYFRIFQVLLMPIVIRDVEKKELKYIFLLIFIIYFSLIWFVELSANAHHILPYQWIF